MYSIFENLSEEKRSKIIDCALAEFAEKGYEQASTNNIVKEAGISKGILFHYFKTKKDLYKYLLFYSIDIMYTKMIKMMDFKSNDYFERMLEVSAIKMSIQIEYPEIYSMVVDMYRSNQQDIIQEIVARYMPLLGEYFQKLNAGIDMTKFREGTDINRLNEIITWIAEGMSNKLVKGISKNIEDMPRVRQMMEIEFLKYAEMLKAGVYK
ncbi:MAG: TetR/AcrR family transcriptional regulator [Bacillota bacterium]